MTNHEQAFYWRTAAQAWRAAARTIRDDTDARKYRKAHESIATDLECQAAALDALPTFELKDYP